MIVLNVMVFILSIVAIWQYIITSRALTMLKSGPVVVHVPAPPVPMIAPVIQPPVRPATPGRDSVEAYEALGRLQHQYNQLLMSKQGEGGVAVGDLREGSSSSPSAPPLGRDVNSSSSAAIHASV